MCRLFRIKSIVLAIIAALLLLPLVNRHLFVRQQQALAAGPIDLTDDQIERLIDRLLTVSEQSEHAYADRYGAAPLSIGGDAGIIQSPAPGSADALLAPLIAGGVKSVPHLVAHLKDARRTNLVIRRAPARQGPPGSSQGLFGSMPMSWRGEYDTGVDANGADASLEFDSPPKAATTHVIMVGDLCFAALGQIVDRRFNPVPGQIDGPTVINSPITSPALADRAAKDWGGLTVARHQQSLLNDLKGGRRCQAIVHLVYYYPHIAEPLVLEELKRPLYSQEAVQTFINALGASLDPQSWEKSHAAFVAAHPPAFDEAAGAQLLQRSLQPDESLVPRGQPDPRLIVARIYPELQGRRTPIRIAAVTEWEQAEFIRCLHALPSSAIDQAVYRLYRGVGAGNFERDDDLALACMERLIGKAHDPEFIDYCRSRVDVSPNSSSDLRKMLIRLTDR